MVEVTDNADLEQITPALVYYLTTSEGEALAAAPPIAQEGESGRLRPRFWKILKVSGAALTALALLLAFGLPTLLLLGLPRLFDPSDLANSRAYRRLLEPFTYGRFGDWWLAGCLRSDSRAVRNNVLWRCMARHEGHPPGSLSPVDQALLSLAERSDLAEAQAVFGTLFFGFDYQSLTDENLHELSDRTRAILTRLDYSPKLMLDSAAFLSDCGMRKSEYKALIQAMHAEQKLPSWGVEAVLSCNPDELPLERLASLGWLPPKLAPEPGLTSTPSVQKFEYVTLGLTSHLWRVARDMKAWQCGRPQRPSLARLPREYCERIEHAPALVELRFRLSRKSMKKN